MQRGFIIPLVLVGMLIIGGLVVGSFFFNQPTRKVNLEIPKKLFDQNENLKTYTNKSLGFEFQYAKDLTVKEDSEEEFNRRGNGDFRKNFTYYVTYQPAKVIGAVSVLDESRSFDTNPLTVWVFDNQDDLTIDKWYLNFWYYPFVWGDYTARRNNVAPEKEATISGQIAKYGVVTYQPGEPKFLYLKHNGKMYLIRIINKEDKLGNQILSTFKFLQ